MKTRTSIKLIVAGLLLAGAGIGLKVAVRYTRAEHVTALARKELEKAFGTRARLGAVEHAGGGLFVVRDLTLTEKGAAQPAVEAPRLLVQFNVAQAVSGRIVARKVTAVDPVLRVSFSPEERRWNLEGLLPELPERPAPPGRPERPAGPGLLEDGIVLENARLVVAHEVLFGDGEARELGTVNARIRPSGPSGRLWTFEGLVTGGPFAGARLAGWVEPGKRPRLEVDFECTDLRADEAVLHATPYWHRAPEGISIAGRLNFTGALHLDETGHMGVRLDVDLSDGGIRTPYYPLGICDATGHLTVSEDRLFIRDVRGRVPETDLGEELTGGQCPQVRVNGSVSLRRGASHLGIEASDLPVCRRTIEGIPKAGPDVWVRLQPEGVGKLLLTLTFPPPGEGRTRFVADVDVRGVTAHPREVPVPLRDLTGKIIVSNEGIRLNGLCGLVVGTDGQVAGEFAPATFRADGFVDFEERIDSLRLSLENLRTEEALVRSIPRVGDDLWRLFRPQVCADAVVLVQDMDGQEDRSCTVLASIHGGRAEPEFLGMPLTDVAGSIRVDGGRVFVEELSGVLHTEGDESADLRARSVFRMRGTVDPVARPADVDLAAGDLMLNERVLHAIPRVGEKLWEEAHPVGVAALSGKVTYRGPDEPVRFFLDMDLRDVAVLARWLPVPVDALSGQLLVTEKRLVSNRISGVSCGGSFDAAMSIYYGPDAERPRFAGSVSFGQVDLGMFVAKFTRKQSDLRGRVSGTLDLGGEVGDQTAVLGNGQIRLEDGYLWSRPLFASILSVLHLTIPKGADVPAEGSATFALAGDTISVKAFDLTGGGLSLSGRGDVKLNGDLNLTMVAVGAPEKSGGIPLVTPFVNWLMRLVERELVRLDVTGTLSDPQVDPTVLSKITWPLTNLRSVLISPLLGSGGEPGTGD
jgi:hypothetical protein